DFENTKNATLDHSRQIDQLFEIAKVLEDDTENLKQESKELKEDTKRVSETTEILKENQESYNNYYTQRFNTIDEKINSVLGEVFLDDIDNYFSGDINDYVNHNVAGSYKVVHRESRKIMGLIDVMTDAHESVLVLILTTSCVVKGTWIDASLHNYYPKPYCRYRNTSGWSDWEPMWNESASSGSLQSSIKTLTEDIDNVREETNNIAATTNQRFIEIENSITPKRIYVDQIDSFFNNIDLEIYFKEGESTTYQVIKSRESKEIVGKLEIVVDSHRSVIAQILTTSCVVKPSGMDLSIWNYTPGMYSRHINQSEWTDWEPLWAKDIENLHEKIQGLVKILDADEYKNLSENNMINTGQIYFVR
ncbi:MAG: hypothetical protein HDS10_01185, partial [Bacteroides sp.]|nr:hypothetical protein [Bacteroides sp.]